MTFLIAETFTDSLARLTGEHGMQGKESASGVSGGDQSSDGKGQWWGRTV
jgi:hypothetical protein